MVTSTTRVDLAAALRHAGLRDSRARMTIARPIAPAGSPARSEAGVHEAEVTFGVYAPPVRQLTKFNEKGSAR